MTQATTDAQTRPEHFGEPTAEEKGHYEDVLSEKVETASLRFITLWQDQHEKNKTNKDAEM